MTLWVAAKENYCLTQNADWQKDEKVYLLSVDGGVRVAICSLSMEDVKGLAAKIQRVISKNS